MPYGIFQLCALRQTVKLGLMLLAQLQKGTQLRADEIASAYGAWPCRKGCPDCCRNLASEPRVSPEEWREIAGAILQLPTETREAIGRRIQESSAKSRPVVCPLLDVDSGSCLVYGARPIACRAYGFYADREGVLGCSQIEATARESANIIWGNNAALEERLRELGEVKVLSAWLESEGGFIW